DATAVHAERRRGGHRRRARGRPDARHLIASMLALRQTWPTPSYPRPIVMIGAGAIVRTAHLPAYRRLGFPIAGVFDVKPDAAADTAHAFNVPMVFATLEDAA